MGSRLRGNDELRANQLCLELGGNKLPVVLTNLKGDILETTAAEQLPNAFDSWDLNK
jgi:cytidine deaminase